MLKRIALIGRNTIEYVKILISIWNNNDCAVLLDWKLPCHAINSILQETYVSTCYVEKDIYQHIKILDIPNEIQLILYDVNPSNVDYLPKDVYDSFIEKYDRTEAVILYSSGTTGKSKGIILSHYAINVNADSILEYMKPKPHDCMYIVKKFSHSSTLVGELLVGLKARIKMVIGPVVISPKSVFCYLKKFDVSIICVNPTILSIYADEYSRNNYHIPSLKTIYVSGSILNQKLYEKSKKIFKEISVYNVYGLSEAGPRVCAQRKNCCIGNSVGKPIDNVNVVIVNKNGTLLGVNEIGIIHVKTPSLFNGYIVGVEKNQTYYNDYLNTGDLGYFDSNGELHIIGRIDEIISINSMQVYPHFIENFITENSNVFECIIQKISIDNVEFLVCAYVSDQIIDEKYIYNKLKITFLPQEIPKMFIRLHNYPRNINGKINRREICKILTDCITNCKHKPKEI